ncbi:hypothetical protein [Mesorhizobium carmichaelinearum]|uniref:hypothetical protein n=1 Tax=Mesorhizobium carmichaelinearum TaxID=1208188 RepID=UPI000BA3685A|nr:hypothetical protein [Mesorhizobium carmichaelinearum]
MKTMMLGAITVAIVLSGCQAAPYLIAGAMQGMAAGSQKAVSTAPAPVAANTRSTHTCYAAGEFEDGLNKTCLYDCPTGRAAATVSAAAMCPMTMQQ